MSTTTTSYTINLDFETIKLPPVSDMLILGKKVPQGKHGVLHSFQLISPDVFEVIEINDDINKNIEAVIVNKTILKKLPTNTIIKVLSEHVFPFVTKGETVKVNFDVHIFQKDIKGDIDDDPAPDK
ncbi:hypothetical protein [Marispirochaeta aestuarii]|uniref:hypothetical protein n=1 Tax=Marispirochaeta aestuarii TaxID=1963862 RepID=UPI0029C9285B|nr:hypothetical protein [Marispirochaeta aestuarii]